MSTELPRWIVSLIRGKRPVYIATVKAESAESAISGVIKDRQITDREYIKRMTARPG